MARALSPRRAAEVRAALQMAVGAMAALYLATWLNLPHPYWSVISAIVVIQASVGGGVLTVARDRAIGTATGALAGAVFAFLRPPGLESMALSIAVSAGLLAFLAAGRPWLKVAPVTATIVIAGGTGAEGPASLALDRVMEILVGSGVGVLAILALFPRHARQSFKLQAREAAGETMDNTLIRIEEVRIHSASLDGKTARIALLFVADIAAVTRDRDGTAIAGSLDDAIESRDVWTFSRNVSARDPNWLLDETDEG